MPPRSWFQNTLGTLEIQVGHSEPNTVTFIIFRCTSSYVNDTQTNDFPDDIRLIQGGLKYTTSN